MEFCIYSLKSPWDVVEKELLEEKHINPETVEKISKYVQMKGLEDLIELLEQDELLTESISMKEGLEDMKLLLLYCRALGIIEKISFDLSLARGLDYYTGVIYEAVLKGFEYDPTKCPAEGTQSLEAESKGKKKKQKKGKVDEDAEYDPQGAAVGSVAGGGRYDNLVGMFDSSGHKVPCVGVSFGVERLLAIKDLMSRNENSAAVRSTETDVMIIVAHKGLIIPRMEIAQQLWDAHLKCTYSYKNNPKILDQLQYCESSGIPYAVVIGDAELKKGVVKLRNITTREESEVPRDGLVAELKSCIDK